MSIPNVLNAQVSCEADHRVLLTDYSFSPAELVIAPGETVAFINAEGRVQSRRTSIKMKTKTGEIWQRKMRHEHKRAH